MKHDLLLEGAMRRFVADHLTLDQAGFRLHPFQKPADLPGPWIPSHHPIYRVDAPDGGPLAILKLIRVEQGAPDAFARLAHGTALINALSLKRSSAAGIIATARVAGETSQYDACLMGIAPGKKISEGSESLFAWGAALAELHSSRQEQAALPPLAEIEPEHQARFAHMMEAFPTLLPFGKELFFLKLKEKYEQIKALPAYFGIVHGDPDLTNAFYDPAQEKVVLIDLDNATERGNLHYEFVTAKELISKTLFFQQQDETAALALQKTFTEGYLSLGKPLMPNERQEEFYMLLYALRKIVWITVIAQKLANNAPSFAVPLAYRSRMINYLTHALSHDT